MTRRSSVRAHAREVYRELAKKKASDTKARTPSPNPSPQGGGEKQREGGRGQHAEPDLTARVKALYEDSAVPVREIAVIAGVTERTLYKYVEKHNWKRRYRVVGRWQAVVRANRGRKMRPKPGFAPVKGAGGRFIRRGDKGKPLARGLKATDPSGAIRAHAACGEAEHLSREAQVQAAAAQRLERQIAAMACVNEAVKNLREHREARQGKAGRLDIMVERGLTSVVEAALGLWEAQLEEVGAAAG